MLFQRCKVVSCIMHKLCVWVSARKHQLNPEKFAPSLSQSGHYSGNNGVTKKGRSMCKWDHLLLNLYPPAYMPAGQLTCFQYGARRQSVNNFHSFRWGLWLLNHLVNKIKLNTSTLKTPSTITNSNGPLLDYWLHSSSPNGSVSKDCCHCSLILDSGPVT